MKHFIEAVVVPAAKPLKFVDESRVAGAAATLLDFLMFYSQAEELGTQLYRDHEQVCGALNTCRAAVTKIAKMSRIKLELVTSDDLRELSQKLLGELDAFDFLTALGSPSAKKRVGGHPGKSHAHLWIYFMVRWIRRSEFIGYTQMSTEQAASFLCAVMRLYKEKIENKFVSLEAESIRKYHNEFCREPKLRGSSLEVERETKNISVVKVRRKPGSGGARELSYFYFATEHFDFITKHCYEPDT